MLWGEAELHAGPPHACSQPKHRFWLGLHAKPKLGSTISCWQSIHTSPNNLATHEMSEHALSGPLTWHASCHLRTKASSVGRSNTTVLLSSLSMTRTPARSSIACTEQGYVQHGKCSISTGTAPCGRGALQQDSVPVADTAGTVALC